MLRLARSLLRQASVLLVLACFVAGPAFAQGPAPDPAPPKPQAPKPEKPHANPAPQPPPKATEPPPAPPPPPSAASPPPAAVVTPSPPAPAPVQSVTPVRTSPPAAAPRRPVTRPKVKAKVVKQRTTSKPVVRRALPKAAAVAPSNSALRAGGLLLVALVLADCILLAVSARYLRDAY
jgi:hypothetical protein